MTSHRAPGTESAVHFLEPGDIGTPQLDDLRDRWPDDAQRERALTSLLADGLLHRHPDGRISLPGAAVTHHRR